MCWFCKVGERASRERLDPTPVTGAKLRSGRKNVAEDEGCDRRALGFLVCCCCVVYGGMAYAVGAGAGAGADADDDDRLW